MTVVPSLLLTGVLAIVLGIIVATWSGWFVQRSNGGLVLVLLSILMMLVGGGIAPPVFGVIAGVIGTRVKRVQTSEGAAVSFRPPGLNRGPRRSRSTVEARFDDRPQG